MIPRDRTLSPSQVGQLSGVFTGTYLFAPIMLATWIITGRTELLFGAVIYAITGRLAGAALRSLR